MNFLARTVLLLGLLVVMVACQPSAPVVLPTLADANAIATDSAATAAVDAATAAAIEAANRPSPLPSTWTPSPIPTEIPTITPFPTATPIVGQGTIYYLYNGDSIVSLKADGTFEQLILLVNTPAELILSPDGKFLAYSAQGSGSAREIFITSLDGTYVQQVSCLGFPRILAPTWSPDSTTLAFAASQTIDGPLGIYSASIIGSGQCPSGNNQKLLAQTDQNTLSDIAWNNEATQLFFSTEAVYGIDLLTNVLFPPLTSPTGYGPDFALAYQPGSNQLFYLKTDYDAKTGYKAGRVYQVDTSSLTNFPLRELRNAPLFALALRWSPDGRYLLASTAADVFLQDARTNSSQGVVQGSKFYPQAVLSPDAGFVAFVDGALTTPTIPQIFTVTIEGDKRKALTTHSEGTITDLNWSNQ